ncbi:MAG: SUMF1/EgtB/PvdO family nonheme iron enzyme [Planctomyces sp.]|nr:SUMF1/EgtB/PvdO family nonheme iron enzyme [Planctomyces sp.]
MRGIRNCSIRRILYTSLFIGLLVTGTRSADAAQKHAVIVAVRHHRPGQPLAELRYSDADAQALGDVLLRSGYQVTLLTSENARKTENDFLAPASDYIRDAIQNLNQQPLNHSDSVLFVFIGNAVRLDWPVSTDESGKPGQLSRPGHLYFCPMDAEIRNLRSLADLKDRNRLIDFAELYKALEDCKAGQRLMVMDVCRIDPRIRIERPIAAIETLPAMPVPGQGAGILFSCGPHQSSIEDGQLQHGVFMNFLIEGLQGAADRPLTGRTPTYITQSSGVESSGNQTFGPVQPPATLGNQNVSLEELVHYVKLSSSSYVASKFPTMKQDPDLRGMPPGMWPIVSLYEQKPAADVRRFRGEISRYETTPDQEFSDAPIDGWEDQSLQSGDRRARQVNWDLASSDNSSRSDFNSVRQAGLTRNGSLQQFHSPDEVVESGAGPKPGTIRNFLEFNVPFCWCPPGSFTMGTPGHSEARERNETQARVIHSEGFWISQTEVTQGLWSLVMPDDPWRTHFANGAKEGDDFPAAGMTWTEAMDFCRVLTEVERAAGRLKQNEVYRLPTEAEWEYACRAGSKENYCFGDDEHELGEFGWFRSSSQSPGSARASHVALKRPNQWNICDMHGNVSEWCLDVYIDNVQGGTDPLTDYGTDLNRVRRGGSFRLGAGNCRSAYRFGAAEDHRLISNGFRFVRSTIAHSEKRRTSQRSVRSFNDRE